MTRVYFTDRDLGLVFPTILRQAGLQVEVHRDHFSPDAPDELWIAESAQRGWVAVTHDARIRYKPNELSAVKRHKAALLVMVGHATNRELADNFVKTADKISAFLEGRRRPFIAKVLRPTPSELGQDQEASGRLELWYPTRR